MSIDIRDIAVVIPARNEAARIGTCLAALAAQCADRVRVILVVNNTVDDTVAAARLAAAAHDLDLEILTCILPQDQGVGSARQLGCRTARHVMPHLRYLLTTDADCIVAPDWVSRNVAHLGSADVVCGRVEPIAAEAGVLEGIDRVLALNEGIYRDLVQQVFARYGEKCADLLGSHGEAPGASLGFRQDAYFANGGFEPVKCSEDRRIVRTMRLAGKIVRHADDVIVHASCRLSGRAAGGMSDALKARIAGRNYLIDDGLAGADWLVSNALAGTLGAWPAQVLESDRVRVQDLPRNIGVLQTFLGASDVAWVSPARAVASQSGRGRKLAGLVEHVSGLGAPAGAALARQES